MVVGDGSDTCCLLNCFVDTTNMGDEALHKFQAVAVPSGGTSAMVTTVAFYQWKSVRRKISQAF